MKPFIIPVFISHAGCPHQCAFCNQKAITGQAGGLISIAAAREPIDRFLAFPHDTDRTVQISFYGGNFLGLPGKTICALLDLASGFVDQGQVDGIRFSTRPDTVTPQTLRLIREFPVKTVEIGVQSMDDRVLAKSRRGHTTKDTENALGLLSTMPYEIGLQMMTGLPGDNDAATWMTARRLAEFTPAFVRIYPALVLKGSPMAAWYASGEFMPLSLDQAVARAKGLYLFFKQKSIPVIRMGLQASEELDAENTVLAGPYHPAFGHLVLSSIWLDKAVALLAAKKIRDEKVVFHVRPENISRVRGQKNGNIATLIQQFRLKAIDVKPDEKIGDEDIRLELNNTIP
jgi:histone acetyltransferase (RNA polymerase elongator complex component)